MATIYKNNLPERQVLSFAYQRQQEIEKQIEQLNLEFQMWQRIRLGFEDLVCPVCNGARIIMKPIEGCECDGPRQHDCEACNGAGKPKASA